MQKPTHLLNYHDAVIYPSDLALLDSRTAWLNDACIHFQMTRLQQRHLKHRQQEKGGDLADNGNGDGDDGGTGVEHLEDLFLDPSVVSFLMHQLVDEDDEDYEDELSNLRASWKLPELPTETSAQETMQRHRYPKRKRIFIPISDQFGASRSTFARPGGGSHWSLLLWTINSTKETMNDGFYHFDSSSGYNAMAAQAVADKVHKVLCYGESSIMPSKTDNGAANNAMRMEVVECITPQQGNGYDCGVFACGFAEALSSCASLSSSDDTIENENCKKRYESILKGHFDERGGQEEFAKGLRKSMSDDISMLAKKK